ncbi:hypothetical protein BDV36DRAFT_298889 [Aspergillus pseudocaelatus]|uniref:Uncharacterized protein n=1 Tax=Aspergillus pseudocaelatus TaxID=1825620 RepID=A0ABQ6WEH2_9EURO|nr:hypothetical protein BDV36DRAFT_298889 [Aspergillus pseudocaelatus]
MANFKLPTLFLIASSALSHAGSSFYSLYAYSDAKCQTEIFSSATGSFDLCVDMTKEQLRSVEFGPDASAIKCPSDSAVVLSVYGEPECKGDGITFYDLEGCLPLSKNHTLVTAASWHARCAPRPSQTP